MTDARAGGGRVVARRDAADALAFRYALLLAFRYALLPVALLAARPGRIMAQLISFRSHVSAPVEPTGVADYERSAEVRHRGL